MENTEHYNLNLPEGDDIYNVRDFNQNSEILDEVIYDMEDEIREMKRSFRAGVDACYDACEVKGSRPASHALDDVVQGILDIPTGGGSGDCYSMFPQEIRGYNDEACTSFEGYLTFNDGSDIYTAHIISSDSNSINVNCLCKIKSYYIGTVSFSLVIDGTTVIPNIASVYVDGYAKEFTFSYTLLSPLSNGYHVLSVRSDLPSDMYYGEMGWPMCTFYGNGFTAAQYLGYYLINGTFCTYYTPSNFVVPTNPITYELYNYFEPGGCIMYEDVEEAINNHYSNTFDSGNSYHIEGIEGYLTEIIDPETGDTDWEYIVPSIADTLSYTNGKIIYNHSDARRFPSTGGCDVGVKEQHCFILPINAMFLGLYNYINIHGKLSRKDGVMNYDDILDLVFFERIAQDELSCREDSYYSYIDLTYFGENEEFTLSFDISNISNNRINFIGIHFRSIDSADDPFTIEIDKIWGSKIMPDSNNY